MPVTINIIILIIGTLLLVLNPIILQSIHVNAIKFEPVGFDKIPKALIKSNSAEYKFGADYSLDFGDETVVTNDTSAENAKNMTLFTNATHSLKIECDGNDICGTNLAPNMVKIYLVDSAIQDKQIMENSIPILELESNDCSTKPIEVCANFNFSIPDDILIQDYKIVVDMSFDEAQWIFINPVKIL